MEIAVLSVFGLAVAAPSVHRVAGHRAGWLLALLPAGLFVYFLAYAPDIADGQPATVSREWIPELGISFAFYLDGLSLLFALLVTGIGALIVVYAGGYLGDHRDIGRFYAFLFAFMGSMLGLVLADNLFLLFSFWELTTISSFLLIGFEHEEEDARRAAVQALIVTNLGGLAMLAGLVLLSQITGETQFSAINAAGDAVRDDDLYLAALVLVALGAFTKSAQVPFHFWLPGAMAAPTPVSAYLHSATMVKAGVYLLARLSPALGGTDEWNVLLSTVGAATMVTGGVIAFYQTDLKRLLAYSTVSALGTLVLFLGLDTETAATGMVVFLLAHALYKGAMFMVAGAIDHETGTRDVTRLQGLVRVMPLTAVAGVLAALSMAGAGPLLSFIGKELLIEAELDHEGVKWLLVGLTVMATATFGLVGGLTGIRPFAGALVPTPKVAHEAGAGLLLGPMVLGVLGIVFGLAPFLISEWLLEPATSSILREGEPEKVALWHGFNLPLATSMVSLALAVAAYFAWDRLREASKGAELVMAWGPERWYRAAMQGLRWVALIHTRTMQSGYLRIYLLATVLVTVGVGSYTMLVKSGFDWPGDWSDVEAYNIGLVGLMLLAALVAAASGSRLAAVAALGVVGYTVALTYILFGAPDLAMTQFMVETLTVVLFLAVFYHLPVQQRVSSAFAHLRDAVIALAAGAFMTALVLVMSSNRAPSEVATYYAENSVPEAHGRNIVNVILVDFRALDTLGEITVLGVAAFGVYALLRLRPIRRESGATGPKIVRQYTTASRPVRIARAVFSRSPGSSGEEDTG